MKSRPSIPSRFRRRIPTCSPLSFASQKSQRRLRRRGSFSPFAMLLRDERRGITIVGRIINFGLGRKRRFNASRPKSASILHRGPSNRPMSTRWPISGRSSKRSFAKMKSLAACGRGMFLRPNYEPRICTLRRTEKRRRNPIYGLGTTLVPAPKSSGNHRKSCLNTVVLLPKHRPFLSLLSDLPTPRPRPFPDHLLNRQCGARLVDPRAISLPTPPPIVPSSSSILGKRNIGEGPQYLLSILPARVIISVGDTLMRIWTALPPRCLPPPQGRH